MVKVIALLVASIVSLPSHAYCCINTTLGLDEAQRKVKFIESQLLAGNYERVRSEVLSTRRFPNTLVKRAQLLGLIAFTRLLGAMAPLERHTLGTLIFELEELRSENPDDPVLQARVAEAKALVAGERDEARLLIDDLVARDLMPDAEAWATAAYLRTLADDPSGRDEALSRCKQIAKKRKHACKLPVL